MRVGEYVMIKKSVMSFSMSEEIKQYILKNTINHNDHRNKNKD